MSKIKFLPSKKAKSILSDKQGSSLIEILVAVGILGIIGLVSQSLMVRVQTEYASVSNRITQEIDSENLAFNLKYFLSRAVELRDITKEGGVFQPLNESNGQIQPYDLSKSWTASKGPGKGETLALFFMDMLKSDAPAKWADADRFLPIGIFFTQPTVDKYGVLSIHQGDSTSASVNGVGSAPLRFTHIVDLKIELVSEDSEFRPTPLTVVHQDRVATVLVHFTKRAYKIHYQSPYVWCPPEKMGDPACATQAAYSDIRETIEIPVRNNILGYSPNRREVVDPMAIVKSYQPARKRRFDGIYFLRPAIPLDALKR